MMDGGGRMMRRCARTKYPKGAPRGDVTTTTSTTTSTTTTTYLGVLVVLHLVLQLAEASGSPKPCEHHCFSGTCVNGTCVCDRGWVGERCQHCQGRFK
ncbi:hypothetical protein NHX12_022351 [Muraenolepis orangiensis]|uniref:EGF-like domain-containing protein n=1 Tax=Muraenolepis orangiensis TaxID=630683 RepID=A0A9Q0IR73_9TELE|nr:hypothetical protein NHX12_022351 [Muraenolepis orangiensis]